MKTEEQTGEIASLESQIETLSAKFDHAIKKDLELSETKKIFRELKKAKERLDKLTENTSKPE